MQFTKVLIPATFEKTKHRLSRLIDPKLRDRARESPQNEASHHRKHEAIGDCLNLPLIHGTIEDFPDHRPHSAATTASSTPSTAATYSPTTGSSPTSSRPDSQSTSATSDTSKDTKDNTAPISPKQSPIKRGHVKRDSVLDQTSITKLTAAIERECPFRILERRPSHEAPECVPIDEDLNADTLFPGFERGKVPSITVTADEVAELPDFHSRTPRQGHQSEDTYLSSYEQNWQRLCDDLKRQVNNIKDDLRHTLSQLEESRHQSNDLASRLQQAESVQDVKRKDFSSKISSLTHELATKDRSLRDQDQLIDRLIKDNAELQMEKRVSDNVRNLMWKDLEKVRRTNSGESTPKANANEPAVWWV